VHRDVKPANVIVGEQDLVKVTDFGIARITGDASLTATGSVLGSAHYISPEQANGVPASPASDIYSTGIVVYEMVTGSLPFTGDSPVGVAMRHVTDDVPRPSSLNPDVPATLDAVVVSATARAPENRYRDASAMAAALQAAVGGTGEQPVVTATSPAGAGATAPMTDPGQTVWPIPGDRWDPQRIGRLVALVFALLFTLAIVLVVIRVTTNDEPGRQGRRADRRGSNQAAAQTEPAKPSPSPSTTVPDVVEETFEDAETILLDAGFEVDRNDLAMAGVEEGVVFGMSPEAGSAASPGTTITLNVSTGEESGDEDDEENPPGHGGVPPGQAKKDKDKGKDED
jgi:serine/threonine-protein kinase